MSINLGLGSRLPAYCTSMGRVLLADLPADEVRERLNATERRALTARTVTDLSALQEIVAQVRQRGWCLVNQELEEGLVSLAAPIRDRSGRVIAAMNISGQANRTPAPQMIEQFLPKLLAAAQRIGQLLQMKS
jgi:IclR family pca regulon transcriptional regulator